MLSNRDFLVIIDALCDKLDDLQGGEEYAMVQDTLHRVLIAQKEAKETSK